MCTMIAHQVQVMGRGKSGPEWFEVREANVSYDHPYDLPLEHALNIDFVNEALGPGARVAEGLVDEVEVRSEEHTPELQSLTTLVCRLLLGKNKSAPPVATGAHRT